LVDKKPAIYSSRPPAPLANNVASAGRRQLFMKYGPRYRTVRKISHALLNITKSTAYQPVQDLESKQLMYDLLHDPEHFYDHNRRYSASMLISVTDGHRIGTWDNPFAKSSTKSSTTCKRALLLGPGWLTLSPQSRIYPRYSRQLAKIRTEMPWARRTHLLGALERSRKRN
jgi:hypothetical protein